MAYNLFSFVEKPFTPQAEFNLKKWYEYVYEGTRLGDNLVDLEAEYIERIIQKIKSDPEPEEIKERELKLWEDSKAKSLAGRRMGMGITAMGDTLAALGLKYDSEEALKAMEEIFSVKLKAELDCSVDLSITRGSFEGWSTDIEYPSAIAGNSFYNFIEKTFPEQTERMQKYGRRNVNISTIAPTGSVSLLTHTTSGIEPLFKAFHIRRKKVNPGEVGVRVDFVDDVGDSWTEFPVLHPKFKEWLITKGYQDIGSYDKIALQTLFEESPWYKSEAEDIDWVSRVAIQSLAQKYITNAISSTINLPSTVTHEQVSEIYLKGWEMGLKGQTVYVDGSRSGVLVSEPAKTNANREDFEYVDAVKRPKELECFAHRSTSKGVEYSVIVGLLNNRPYEIFITEGKAYGNGVIRKEKQGEYVFVKTGVAEDKQFEEQITANMTEEQEAITRLASGMLRHGADVKFVVEQFRKTSGSMFDFTASLARVLKKYIKEGVDSTMSCESCGEKNVIFEEGCSKCLSCGFSACN